MIKKISIVVLVVALMAAAGWVYLNRERFMTPLQQEENKTTQFPTVEPTAEPSPVDLEKEVTDLDAQMKLSSPDEFKGDDLQDSSLGL